MSTTAHDQPDLSDDAAQIAQRLRSIAAHWEKNAGVARKQGRTSEAAQWNACAAVLEDEAKKIAAGQHVGCCPNCGRNAMRNGRLLFACRMGWCSIFTHPVHQ